MTPDEYAQRGAFLVGLSIVGGADGDVAKEELANLFKAAIFESHYERCLDEGHQFMKTKCMWCGIENLARQALPEEA